MDYRDLKKVSPKNDFSLPNIHIILDNTARHEIDSFINYFTGYHQVQVTEKKNKEKSAFVTPSGTFYNRIMPLNTKATY